MEKELVFISWTGELGKKLALTLKETMFKLDPFEGWVSDVDIETGAAWFQSTKEALKKAKIGIVCLTPESSKRPWINFEAGYLYGQINKCQLVKFKENLINPLKQLQAMDGTKLNDWQKLLCELTGNRNNYVCEKWAQSEFPKLQEIINLIDKPPHSSVFKINQTLANIQEIADSLKDNRFFRENIYYQEVIYDSYLKYRRLNNDLNDNQSRYLAPASQYPHILISLQKNISPVVKAIALVNIEEQFWQQRTGKEILRTSHHDNIRVFVFTSEKDFESNYLTILEHAKQYKVYGISFANLSTVLGSEYSKDFSIIEGNGKDKLLAKYDDEALDQKNICFIAEEDEISKHEKKFNDLLESKLAISIPETAHNDEVELFIQTIFTGLTVYETKHIEMSAYINVNDYDEHEEKHAYYQDMMQKMFEICLDHRRNNPASCRILEFGAGTGIFTKRLNEMPNVDEIVAIEIDWRCYGILEHKFRKQGKVKPLYADSRTYDPEGKFDYIFSSFADHHIKRGDKQKYFHNVKRNLNPGGLMIVGDEFIRSHNPINKEERKSALKEYHNHIIEIARQQGEDILALLEEKALESGLEEKGDFKVSCEQYEGYLNKAGFKFKQERIGPPDPELAKRIGGVYVYKAWLPNDS
ncbi:methyltransferase domain-containing protein [Aerosakkonema funiforme]|uniref:Methyltransferase domain-containing protein n=1 Tax=Aerosakkonema funiforme FACHB-1375 TaxID=2949571 RepID=A0A926VEA4_9CYAN|nr:methyltransferase domain-containing protein [Aerosakkonema funiforme]MBD2180884.1 methyltransferase domain-containing protein [Aerosakkonema funiforme FACHB-1375]